MIGNNQSCYIQLSILMSITQLFQLYSSITIQLYSISTLSYQRLNQFYSTITIYLYSTTLFVIFGYNCILIYQLYSTIVYDIFMYEKCDFLFQVKSQTLCVKQFLGSYEENVLTHRNLYIICLYSYHYIKKQSQFQMQVKYMIIIIEGSYNFNI